MRQYAATGVILDSDGRVLLVRERQPDHAPWVTPGGVVEESETPREAAQREILEECGVVARAGEFVGAYVSRADGLLGFAFLAEISSGTPAVPAGDEIMDVGWFDPSNLPAACPSLASALIADAVAGRLGVYREL
jgi:8-oxo-dGTP diphosphatase